MSGGAWEMWTGWGWAALCSDVQLCLQLLVLAADRLRHIDASATLLLPLLGILCEPSHLCELPSFHDCAGPGGAWWAAMRNQCV